MKKVLIISTSLRNNSNSEILAHQTEQGAKDAGHEVEFVSLKDKNIQFCKGCFACQKLGHCVINDDANEIVAKMKDADVIVWATPIYYYEMSGQMKTLIDRANSLYVGKNFSEVYVITTSEDSLHGVVQTVINGVNGWIACFSGVELKGYVEAGGVNEPKEVTKHQDLLEKAYNMGKNI
ncbi:MAG: flavodoxin family protein [Cyanobacteriota bacterium]|nr:flavodoxin family protein [Cyanobacteriota bacterium]MDY6359248.1 flavodoxin family protein [Cyanobacteriota bacterium]